LGRFTWGSGRYFSTFYPTRIRVLVHCTVDRLWGGVVYVVCASTDYKGAYEVGWGEGWVVVL